MIAPGKAADIVLVNSLAAFRAHTVLVNGRIVVQDGELHWRAGDEDRPLEAARNTVRLEPLGEADFALIAPIAHGSVRAHVMVADRIGTMTQAAQETVAVRDGRVSLDDQDDLALIAVFERYARAGSRGYGLVRGLGLRMGAIASTYAHDSHNLVVMGREARDMALAANAVLEAGGGMAVARDGAVTALVALPIAGIISPHPVAEVAAPVRRFAKACAAIGVVHPHLLMRLSTFTLPVSAGLRITDQGLVDANARKQVSLFVS